MAGTWLRGLWRFAPGSEAVESLERAVNAAPATERPKHAVKLFAALFGNRDAPPFSDLPAAQRVDVLEALIRLAHTYVCPADDVSHEGVYSPDDRDRAQSARDFLLSALYETPGPEARKALVTLANGPLSGYVPDRLRRMAHERAAMDADTDGALDAAAIRALEEKLEAPPADRHGLFGVMIDRLEDYAHDLAHHDFTNRRTLRTIEQEAEMQRSIAMRLFRQGQWNV